MNRAITLPPSVLVAEGTTSGSFTIATNTVTVTRKATISASLAGGKRNATLTVTP
jgi:hypothetical protein